MNTRSVGNLILMMAIPWFIVGCASGPSYTEVASSIAPREPDQGRIYIYRLPGFVGSAAKPLITLDGVVIGRAIIGNLNEDGYLRATLEEHILDAASRGAVANDARGPQVAVVLVN